MKFPFRDLLQASASLALFGLLMGAGFAAAVTVHALATGSCPF